MKILKYLLFAVGGVVLLAFVVLAIVVATFDANKYKPEITAVVKDKTGRTLTDLDALITQVTAEEEPPA